MAFPTNAEEIRGSLGLTGCNRKFIKQYGLISKPLTQVLKKRVHFICTSDTEVTFQTLKQALITTPVLALPNFSQSFLIETDACDIGIVLMQSRHPLAFISKTLGPKGMFGSRPN